MRLLPWLLSRREMAALVSPSASSLLSGSRELRCEVDWELSLTVRLLSGTAEVFGTRLPEGRPHLLQRRREIAVRHQLCSATSASPSLSPSLGELSLYGTNAAAVVPHSLLKYALFL